MIASPHKIKKSGYGKILTAMLSVLLLLWFAALPVKAGMMYFGRSSQHGTKTKTIKITMKDFKFVPSKIHLPTGQKVVLKFKNTGKFAHEFLAGQNVRQDKKGFKSDFFSNIDVKMTVNGKSVSNDRMNKNIGTMMYLKPGQKGTMTFTVPASDTGTYQIGCFKKMGSQNHFQIGMKGKLVVGSSSGNA